jgi:hypothetical protein
MLVYQHVAVLCCPVLGRLLSMETVLLLTDLLFVV